MNAKAAVRLPAAGHPDPLDWLRGIVRRVTWWVPAAALGLGVLFNGLRALEATGGKAQPEHVYIATAVMQTLAAFCVTVAFTMSGLPKFSQAIAEPPVSLSLSWNRQL